VVCADELERRRHFAAATSRSLTGIKARSLQIDYSILIITLCTAVVSLTGGKRLCSEPVHGVCLSVCLCVSVCVCVDGISEMHSPPFINSNALVHSRKKTVPSLAWPPRHKTPKCLQFITHQPATASMVKLSVSGVIAVLL